MSYSESLQQTIKSLYQVETNSSCLFLLPQVLYFGQFMAAEGQLHTQSCRQHADVLDCNMDDRFNKH